MRKNDLSFPDTIEILQKLISFNTVNPPGNESSCIQYIKQTLHKAGIKSKILYKDLKRPNLIARLKGNGTAAPILLYGHVDVVTANSDNWTYPPFEGKISDDFVWGRGTLDMKGGIAMMISAVAEAKLKGESLPGDVILCILSDEEDFGEYGARFMVENHRDLFKDVRFALGEFGGFSLHLSGKKFYPIEVAQKQKCIIRACIRGKSGHGAMIHKGSATAKLGEFLINLDKKRFPIHISPSAKMMFGEISRNLPFPANFLLKQLINPILTNSILNILGKKGENFRPLFHNSANATILRGGDKINVMPDEIQVDMDVRLLPGQSPQQFIVEIEKIVGHLADFKVLLYERGPSIPDMTLFPVLSEILKEEDSEGIPVPLLISGSTDARFFSRLDIQTYGFTPMQLPKELNFLKLLHGVDERIPLKALKFGSGAILKALKRFI